MLFKLLMVSILSSKENPPSFKPVSEYLMHKLFVMGIFLNLSNSLSCKTAFEQKPYAAL